MNSSKSFPPSLQWKYIKIEHYGVGCLILILIFSKCTMAKSKLVKPRWVGEIFLQGASNAKFRTIQTGSYISLECKLV